MKGPLNTPCSKKECSRGTKEEQSRFIKWRRRRGRLSTALLSMCTLINILCTSQFVVKAFILSPKPLVRSCMRDAMRTETPRVLCRNVNLSTIDSNDEEDTSATTALLPSSYWRKLGNILTGHNDIPTYNSTKIRNWLSITVWIFTHLRPPLQLLTALLLYIFHTIVLAQHSISFPFQLIPNERGYFQNVGWDSIAGMATLVAYRFVRCRQNNKLSSVQCNPTNSQASGDDGAALCVSGTMPDNVSMTKQILGENNTTASQIDKPRHSTVLPSLVSTPSKVDMPWQDVWQSYYAPFTSLVAFFLLGYVYFKVSLVSLWWEDRFYELAINFPITVAMHHSLCVLMGHASWIAMGGLILRWVPRPQPFFQQPKSKWFKSNFKNSQWLWWTVGGYFVSSWFVSIAEVLNSYVLPLSVLEAAEQTSVVSRLINPEGQDWLASLVGYLAPCINAPWWEEVLYRGFLLPALILQLGGYKRAVFTSGIIFSIHHSSLPAFLPLCVLGWTWAVLYTKSQNLWTTIVLHSMWNSRIFLTSWWGI
jgi:membrane protease YdiL (CAAX protease family)